MCHRSDKQSEELSCALAANARDEACCTIVSKQHTLNLECDSPQTRALWVEGISTILSAAGKTVIKTKDDVSVAAATATATATASAATATAPSSSPAVPRPAASAAAPPLAGTPLAVHSAPASTAAAAARPVAAPAPLPAAGAGSGSYSLPLSPAEQKLVAALKGTTKA